MKQMDFMMRSRFIILLLATFTISCFAAKSDNDLLKRIVNGDFKSKTVGEMRPMVDGEFFSKMSDDSTAVLRVAYKTGKMVDTLFSVKTARDCKFKKFDGYEFSSDESKMLIYSNKEDIYRHSYKADYFVFELKRNIVYPLSSGGKQQMATFSPNGRMVAFARESNLFLVKLDYGTESQITKDGDSNKITYGIPDWVYEEEFSFNRAFEWSPDNNFVAFLRFDQTKVSEYSFPIYKGSYPSIEANAVYPGTVKIKYPKAGQPNSKVNVMTFNIMTKVIKTMDLRDDEIEYIPRIRFTAQPDKLAIFTLNRLQNKFTIYTASPASGLSRLLIREESDTYIDNDIFDEIAFYPDQIVFMSEKDGYRHLYDYSPIGVQRRQITSGAWEVSRFLGYNAANGSYYYESNEGNTTRNAVYVLDGKGRKTCLTPQDGTNHAELSSNYRYWINHFSNATTPEVTDIREIQTGKSVAILEGNNKLKKELAALNFQNKEFFTFKTSKNILLNGWMVKPINFDLQKRYPVVMVQYGGPHHPIVKDEYKLDWEVYLAQQGYVVVCVDGRGTGGRGVQFNNQTYGKLGIIEAEDQIETARYLSSLSFVDKDKIAIWGWSYGGYNVLMSMSLGNGIFKAGIAVAPVTDWRFYDSVYAERSMKTPNENTEGYELSSAGHYASQLQGNLLIVQGTADDNVHYQNTAEYAEQLVQAGKQFDMQIYTNRNHFLKGGNTRFHLYETFMRFLKQNL
ncbi:MAG: S9 family peptidase [Bacteroidales bacterium]|nr:S9 family peptidase [Bacteroidales bacterium]